MRNYFHRYIEAEIERGLKFSGAILIAGPKFCGKTTTSSLFAKSKITLDTDSIIQLTKLEPKNILQGESPRLIDEWQTVPELWNVTRSYIDEKDEFGQIILTGSSTPVDKAKIRHSGAGRILPIMMRPMTLFESLESKGSVSLKDLFDNPEMSIYDLNNDYSLEDTVFYMCRGGWPKSLQPDRKVALDVTRNYYNGLFSFENSENEKFRNKKPEILQLILRSYARNISTEVPLTTLIEDVMIHENRTINDKTIVEYLEALKDLFILEDIEAWNPNLRSKTVIRSTPTRHFVDTSIACAALSITPKKIMKDLKSLGYFFEDMAVRDLKVYAMSLEGSIKHYRDSRGLECDAVICLDDGRWALIEIKLGGENLVEEGSKNLIKLKQDIDDKQGPAFMMIITATGPAYRRKDGIYVVPINCLKA